MEYERFVADLSALSLFTPLDVAIVSTLLGVRVRCAMRAAEVMSAEPMEMPALNGTLDRASGRLHHSPQLGSVPRGVEDCGMSPLDRTSVP